MHRLLLDTAVHDEAPPEQQLERILNDYHGPDENESEGSISMASLESMDSAIHIPDAESTGLDDGVGAAPDPLWKKIDDLRSRAKGMIDMSLAEPPVSRPALTSSSGPVGGGNGQLSIDILDQFDADFDDVIGDISPNSDNDDHSAAI